MNINTKYVMLSSSIFMGIIGLGLSFVPEELLSVLEVTEISRVLLVLLQIMGGLYFGFAYLNWAGRSAIMGGIYAFPITISNMSHFIIGALSLIKAYIKQPDLILLILAIFYTIFAILFAIIFRTHPQKTT